MESNQHQQNSNAGAEIDAHLVLPGGGVFFFWQIGALSYLQDNFDMSRVIYTGASAGAVAAACLATEVDMHAFIRKTIAKCEDIRLWERRLGLFGVLGEITEDVLKEMLPEDAATKMEKRQVSVLIQPMRLASRVERVSRFRSRGSVINVLSATSHIPWVANGRALTRYHGKAYVDGALFSTEKDFTTGVDAPVTIPLDFTKDPAMKKKTVLDCVKTPPKHEIWELFELGRAFGKHLDEQGTFATMIRKRRRLSVSPRELMDWVERQVSKRQVVVTMSQEEERHRQQRSGSLEQIPQQWGKFAHKGLQLLCILWLHTILLAPSLQ